MESNEYTAKDIMVLSGPQGIRKRPAMYIGSTSGKGFLHLLYEILDNAIDECLAGYAKNITITLSKDEDVDTAEVSDNGRGIPVDIMPKDGRPALEVIMTSIHTGAKFENKVYKVAGGLHGVGLTVVNSLSEKTEVTIKRGGKVYKQMFSRGAPTSVLEIVGECPTEDTGTTIKFKPDTQIFSTKNFDSFELTERLKELAFLNPGLSISYADNREIGNEHQTLYSSKRGIADFVDALRDAKEPLTKQIFISKEIDSVKVEVAMQYVNDYSEKLLSFVNRIKTPEGGTHVIGFHTALTRAISNYMQKNKKQGKGSSEIEGDDTREGLVAVLSILMQNAEFEGQTKEKLGNNSIKSLVDSVVYPSAYYLFGRESC